MSVLFVTGAASGIGARTAELAVARGHRVACADVDAEGADALCARLGEAALAVELDVREPQSWRAALDAAWERFGRVDVLVNNAGVIEWGFLGAVSHEQHRRMLEINVLGAIAGTQEVVPRFRAQGGGHLIDIASLASYVPMSGQATYAASKHALRAFHHATALELRDQPIAFTLICPPAVKTPFLAQQLGDDANALGYADRAVTPEAVARAILRAVDKRPREVPIPALRGRFVRAIGAQPAIARRLLVRAEARGRRRMARLRRAASA